MGCPQPRCAVNPAIFARRFEFCANEIIGQPGLFQRRSPQNVFLPWLVQCIPTGVMHPGLGAHLSRDERLTQRPYPCPLIATVSYFGFSTAFRNFFWNGKSLVTMSTSYT